MIHFGDSDEGENKCWACMYIIDTGKKRPCSGDDCTEFKPRKKPRKGRELLLSGSYKHHGENVEGKR